MHSIGVETLSLLKNQKTRLGPPLSRSYCASYYVHQN